VLVDSEYLVNYLVDTLKQVGSKERLDDTRRVTDAFERMSIRHTR